LYQNAEANIEGSAQNAVIRLDNNSEFTGNKLTIKDLELITELPASINAETSLSISAGEKSEIQIYGNPKIEIRRFDVKPNYSKSKIKNQFK
jgi:hypothetical protein